MPHCSSPPLSCLVFSSDFCPDCSLYFVFIYKSTVPSTNSSKHSYGSSHA
nr:MAG TPA: KaiB domain [Caudoviricetes sp.]